MARRMYTVSGQMRAKVLRPARTIVLPPVVGYVEGIKHVQFRVTKAQDQLLKQEAKALGISRNEAARRRCFPEDRNGE